MGRVLYDEISDFELLADNKSPGEIIKSRWGSDKVIYKSCHNDPRDSLMVWYHNPKFGSPVLSKLTQADIEQCGV